MGARKAGGPTGQGVGDMGMKPADKGTSGPTIAIPRFWVTGCAISPAAHSNTLDCIAAAGEVGDRPGNKLNRIVNPHFQKRFSAASDVDERWVSVF